VDRLPLAYRTSLVCTLMPWARKKDSTHQAVLHALRTYGWTVLDVSRAPLCVDLVIARQQRVVLVEVKDRTGKLTDAQKLLLSSWPGETAILRSLEDVARLTADKPCYSA
jgi:hypothetical protein